MRWEQRKILLEKLTQPRSIRELADELESNYYTVRRHVREVIKEGIVKVLPYRRDKESLYVLTVGAHRGSTLVHTGRKLVTLAELTMELEKQQDVNRLDVLKCALAHIGFVSWAKHVGLKAPDMERHNAFQTVETARKAFDSMAKICEQLLLANQLWKDSEDKIWEHFGADTLEGLRFWSERFQQYIALASQGKPLVL